MYKNAAGLDPFTVPLPSSPVFLFGRSIAAFLNSLQSCKAARAPEVSRGQGRKSL
jgi:hypothetical protein